MNSPGRVSSRFFVRASASAITTTTIACALAVAACESQRREPVPVSNAPSQAHDAAAVVADEQAPSEDAQPPADAATPAAAVAPLPSRREVAHLVDASNQLGFDLWAKRPAARGNLALSPVSISLALTMVAGGARGATAAQLERVLHVRDDATRSGEAWGRISAGLQSADRPGELAIANRLFGERTYPLEPAFVAQTERAFGAPLEPIDLLGDAEAARARINAWVAERTRDRITQLLPPGSLPATARLVAVNAIYFLGEWANRFWVTRTKDAPFFVDGRTARPVPTMHGTMTLRHAKVGGVTIIELPHVGDATSMVLALPARKDGLAAVERSLSARTLTSWLGALASREVELALPRFTVRAPIELTADLRALGARAAFDPVAADFTGIAKPPRPDDRLWLGAVYHQAFVQVDERGTEAAAATAVMARTVGGRPPPPLVVDVDHPFLFFVVDRSLGLVLFMGRVTDPADAGT